MADVTSATIKENTFKNLYTYLNAYKPSGWTVVSSFPEAKPTFPCIVLNPAKVTVSSDAFRLSNRLYEISIELDFYAKASARKEKIDKAVDVVRELFISGYAVLQGYKLSFITDTPIDETDIATLNIGGNKLHTSSMTLKMRML